MINTPPMNNSALKTWRYDNVLLHTLHKFTIVFQRDSFNIIKSEVFH